MKKIIERLEQALALIWNPPTLEIEKKFSDVSVSNIIEEAIEDLKTPRWEMPGPVQVINHVIYEITEALKFLDIKPCPDRDIGNVIEYNLEDGINRLRNLICTINKPRWETPEQWEKRTGEAWPYNSAVYCRGQLDASEDWTGWMINSHRGAVWTYDTFHTFHDYHIVCATRPGPPPDDWRPEENG
jgi:hypothetical protein